MRISIESILEGAGVNRDEVNIKLEIITIHKVYMLYPTMIYDFLSIFPQISSSCFYFLISLNILDKSAFNLDANLQRNSI